MARLQTVSTGFAITLALILVVVSLRTAAVNRSLAAAANAHERTLRLPPGKLVPPLIGHDPDLNRLTISYDGTDTTVIFAFTESCAYCDPEWALWRKLTARASRTLRFVAVDLSPRPTRAYLAGHAGDGCITMTGIDDWTRAKYQLGVMVPEIMVVSGSAVVTGNWSGSADAKTRAEIAEVLGLSE